jgi:small subunit ribosomal protein S13
MMYLLDKKITNWRTTVWKTIRDNRGLSDSAATSICARLGLNRRVGIKSLTTRELSKLHFTLARHFVANDALQGIVTTRFTEIYQERSRHGMRLRQGLPVNGQRTRSNAKTPRRLKGAWLSTKFKQQQRKLHFQRLLRQKKRMQSRKAQLLLRKAKAKAKKR